MIGKTVSHYRILEKLAEGGMGIIYRAEDMKLKRDVVLKFLPPEVTKDSEAKKRFIHEAQSASKLDHPNICTIYEIEETDTGQMFIAMAYYEGETLNQKMAQRLLTLEQTLDICIQITEGLSRAHEEGIIHRDVKPANVMVTNRGEVKILDFGLAKLIGQTGLTQEGIAVGTAAYMSPEQVSGEEVDQRTDIWSIGVMLFEIICKKLPFQGDTPRSIVYSILSKEPANLSDCESSVPEEYKTIVYKCMKKDKKDRYQNISDLQIDLILLKRSIMRQKLTEKIKSAPTQVPILKRFQKILIPLAGFLFLAGILIFIPTTRLLVKNWLGIEGKFSEKHVAILPFSYEGGESGFQIYNQGLVTRLTSKLMMLEKYEEKFWVVSNRILLREKVNSVNKAREIFNVNLVITGSIFKNGNTLILNLNLIDTKNNRKVKNEKLEDHISNLTIWQEGVVLKLIQMLNINLSREKQSLLTAGNTSLPGAFDLYLQGIGSLIDGGTKESLDRAIFLLSQAIKQDESYAEAYLALGKSFLRKFQLTKDPHWVDKGLNHCNRALQITDLIFPVHITKGKIYRESGNYDLAIQEFQQAINKNPNEYRAYLEMAFTYEDSKKLYKAEEMYKRAISSRPDYWIGYEHLGYFYYHTGRLNEAEEMYIKVIGLNPASVTSFNNLISIYNKKGDNIRAHLMFKRSISVKPNSVAYSNMGTNLFYQGRYSDAREMYEKAIKLGRSDRRIWGNLADSYRYSGEYKKRAKEVYREAITLSKEELLKNPRNASVHSSLGLYLAKLGQYNQALRETEIALKLEPNNLAVIYNSIVVFEITRKRYLALASLDDYIERHGSIAIFSKDPDLSKLRNDLRFQKRIVQRENSKQDSENK